MSETPAETLRRAAKLIRERVEALRAEMTENAYWGYPSAGSADAAYRIGVDGGLGGAAGEMAAPWDLSANAAVAALLDKIAWMVGMDAELLGRVGVDETLAVARAYIGEVPA